MQTSYEGFLYGYQWSALLVRDHEDKQEFKGNTHLIEGTYTHIKYLMTHFTSTVN